jgi:hypothetical protein
MKRPTWLRKALWLLPIILILLIVTALIGLHIYLSSGRATQAVAERLQDLLGGRVVVQASDIGLVGDSTLRGISAYEDGEPTAPWLQIDDVKADVSALSVVREKAPGAIQFQGARIALRFDRAGHLLTRLPSKKEGPPPQVPHVHIEQGVLTLAQEGRQPMVIRGITVDITPADNGMTLTGTITDPVWGEWKAQGDMDTAGGKTSIVLDTTEVAVTMDKLKAIAFVPPKVWQQVQVEGPTPARVQLDMQTGGGKASVSYRVEITPRGAHVQVTSIDLDATEATGKAVITDEVVQLDDVRGKIAGGAITTSGDLNFRGEASRLAFKVGVQKVVLHDLPRSWKVPPRINGFLTGKADLVVTIKDGKVHTEGSGKGEIDQARWGRIKIQRPITLTLHSENGRFRFGQPKEPVIAAESTVETADTRETPASERTAFAPVDREEMDENPADLLETAPRRVVRLLNRSVQYGADQMSRGLDVAARALGKLKPPSKPDEEPTYLDVDLNLQDVDLAQLVQKLQLRLPYMIAGRLTIQVHASIPINTPGDMKAYRLRGDAKLPRLAVAGLEMTDVKARVRYANGVLDLQGLQGRVPQPKAPKMAGEFEGSAHVQVVPQGDLQASLTIDRVPLDVALNLLPATKDQATGLVSGTIQGRAPLATLSDLATWRGGATLTSPAIEGYGLTLQKASANLTIIQGQARLTTFRTDVAGTSLTGEGNLELTGAYRFNGRLHLDQTDLTALNRLAPSFRPPIEIKGSAELKGTCKGTLKPLRFDTDGDVQAKNLIAEGFRVDDLSFHWSRDAEGLKLSEINAALYGGNVTGTAVVPLASTVAGRANLVLRALDAQKLSKSIPSFPVRLEGKVSGSVKGAMPADPANRTRTWTTEVDLDAPRLRVQGIPTEHLEGTIESHKGTTSYRLKGRSLGGKFEIKGDLPARGQEKDKEKPAGPVGKGHLTVENARLTKLWEAYDISGGLSHLHGRFFISLPYEHRGPHDFPVGNGRFEIVNIRWDDEDLSSSLQGEVRLVPNQLRLANVSGDFGQGQFEGRFGFGLGANAAGWFTINLRQVEASRLLMPLPAVARHVHGPADVTLRGRIGPEWNGGGGITLTRGQVFGLDVTEWRMPLQFRFAPTQGEGELMVHDSQAQIAQGRARFQSTLNWGNGLRLSGLLLFYQVDLRTLLRHSPELASYASGRVSGRVELGGSEMRSINDLQAIVEAKLQQGQALQMPVLRAITPYLRPGISSATFQSGQLKGRLASGIFRIQHATLVGNFLQLIIEGTVALAGNLDLDVTAQTGAYCLSPAQANAAGARVPLVGAIPRLILYEVSSLLANRIVHLRVTGTVRSPTVRLEPIIVLTEEAIRFFLGRLIAPTIPAIP